MSGGLHEATPILLSDGTWKPVGALILGDQVVTGDGRWALLTGLEGSETASPMVQITTQMGRILHVAPQQNVLTKDSQKLAERLWPGDPLEILGRIQDDFRPKIRSRIDIDLYRLAGAYAALGSYTSTVSTRGYPDFNYQMWISDPTVLAETRALLNRMDLRHTCSFIAANKRNLLRLRVQDGKRLEAQLGLTLKSVDRRVPDWVYRAPDDKAKAYLSTFMLARGETPRKHRVATAIASVRSAAFANDLQRLLARFGVNALTPASHTPHYQVRLAGPALESYLSAGMRFHGVNEPWFKARRAGTTDTLRDAVVEVTMSEPARAYRVTLQDADTLVANGVTIHC